MSWFHLADGYGHGQLRRSLWALGYSHPPWPKRAQLGRHRFRVTRSRQFRLSSTKAVARVDAKLYDECLDQSRIFEAAKQLAAAENKVLLVSYGAEWCIWCHVFAKYIHGETTRFEYSYGRPDAPEARQTSTIFEREERDVKADAAALSAYVARSFVVVHIEGQYAPNGAAVLEKTGAAPFMNYSIPFIFTVDRRGQYAAHFTNEPVEIRRDTDDWYRGYDRRKLLAELQRMHDTASR